MAEEILKELKKISEYLPYSVYDSLYACIAAGQLSEIREHIRKLDYENFIIVLTYVINSDLSPDLKKELEVEHSIRGYDTGS